MTDTTEMSASAVDLSTLRLPQLQAVASQLGMSLRTVRRAEVTR